jgi:glycosyltransferase involved in cell wall biosynthesis/SAM-dependent methyltransferase
MNAVGPDGTAAAPHDRITQAYLGELGERFMQRTQRRIHWMCGQVRGPRILDIGCSQGIVSLLLGRAGHEVTGIDLDAKVVAEARAYLSTEPLEVQSRVQFVHGDAAELPVEESFDTVVLGEILEHLEDPGWLIDVAAGQLAPGGRLVVTVPFGINDFSDHRQTFYLSVPHALISGRFEVAEVEMMGRWIGFAAEKPAEPSVMPSGSLDAAAVPLLEEGIRLLEQMFLEEQAGLRGRLTQLGERLKQFQSAAERTTADLKAARLRILDLEAEEASAKQRARADAQAIRGLQQRLQIMENSTSFQLGHALVLGARSPRRLPRLPGTVWRLWRRARSLPTYEHRRLYEVGGIGSKVAAVVARSVRRQDSEPKLRALFWTSQKAGDFATSWDCLRRIELIYGPQPTVAQAAMLEKLRRSPAYQLSLLELISPPGPCALPPNTGRVVYVLHNSLPWSSGGYATRSHGLARGMECAGLETICITRPGFPLDLKPELTAAELPLCDTVEGINYHRIPSPLRTDLLVREYILAAADAVEAALRRLRPEWVVAASNHVTALPALIAARRLGMPFVYEVRGFWEVTRVSREPDFERSSAFRIQALLEAEVARRADHVFTLTGPMREELVRRGIDAGKITLLPNSCDPDRFTPRSPDAALAARLRIPSGIPVIGYIGTFVQYEGLEDLVAACAMLLRRGRNFRLMLIGNENASGIEKGPITAAIERLAAETELSDRLIMPGRVPHEEVAAYYSLIDIAPFPRKPQPVTEMVSPMKPLEALAMEKAVVVSSVAALTEMIADEETGLVFAKGNLGSLTDALDRLIGDPGLRRRLARNGRDWVVRQRTWAQIGRQVRVTLEELATSVSPVAEVAGDVGDRRSRAR